MKYDSHRVYYSVCFILCVFEPWMMFGLKTARISATIQLIIDDALNLLLFDDASCIQEFLRLIEKHGKLLE